MKTKPTKRKKIAIIGAGPGGLAASLLLAHQGHQVTLFESKDRVGGRSSVIDFDGFSFDAGPTFFIYRYVLDEIFRRIGEKLDEHVELKRLDPLYHLIFPDKIFRPYQDHSLMMKEIHRVFPGEENGYQQYLKTELKRFKKIIPVLQLPFHSPLQYLHPRVLAALGHLDLTRSLYQRLSQYFHSEQLIYSMAFQAKYLGMSPWECPSLFSILSFMEHEYGVYHVMGGIHHLHEKMATLAEKLGVTIKLNSHVNQLIVEKGRVQKLQIQKRTYAFDEVIINGDFARTISLLDNRHRPKKYRDQNLGKLKYSCSTFNLLLGLDKTYPLAHHSIVFSKHYRDYVTSLSQGMTLYEDPSFYIHNPSILDPAYAPKDHSALYILVPVPHLQANIDWEKIKDAYTEKIITRLSQMPELKDIRKHIVSKKVISPLDWQNDYHVYLGANFNLSHEFRQLLYLRPHNQFQGLKNLYLVGGGTHPGSGLPTIYQSAILAADLINR